MIKVLIVADDSTGANASAILLKKINYRTISLIDYLHEYPDLNYDGAAISTDSRAIKANEAYERVKCVLKNYVAKPPLVINKRIDSTLRGNLGAELNAFLDLFPKRKIAIVPSYPTSGRVCKNGLIYVNDILLEHTDVAKDPKMPLTTSDAKTLFLKQFKGKITSLFLDEIRNTKTLKDKIIQLYQQNDAIIFDAEIDDDVQTISKVLVETGIELITVDPGIFTYYYTHLLNAKKHQVSYRYVYLVGSITDTTFKQLVTVSKNNDFDIVPINPSNLINENAVNEKEKAIKKFTESKKPFIVLTTSDPSNRIILDLFALAKANQTSVDEMSKRINVQLADILHQVLQLDSNIRGIFSSGGDTTLVFLTSSGAKGIELQKEVIPLCVFGTIDGGIYHGMQIITKGGMIGNEETYLKIKQFYEKENENV